MLDFEQIIGSMLPYDGYEKREIVEEIFNSRLVVAEDSKMILSMIKNELGYAGFEKVTAFIMVKMAPLFLALEASEFE